eukprot:m.41875 g.41875  ORF g.41875 m.41875 type:complete len:82 (+) comp10467_c0_seq2:301-546(+)
MSVFPSTKELEDLVATVEGEYDRVSQRAVEAELQCKILNDMVNDKRQAEENSLSTKEDNIFVGCSKCFGVNYGNRKAQRTN